MSRLRRCATSLGATTLLVAGSAMLAMPVASAGETISTQCGSSVSGKVGDTVVAETSVLGLNLGKVNLGTIASGTTVLSKTLDSLTGLVCQVTVTVTQAVDGAVDTVTESAPEPLKSATEPLTGAVKDTTEQARKAAGAKPTPESPPEPKPGDSNPPKDTSGPAPYVPPPNNPPYSGGLPYASALPYGGFTPISAFSTPYYNAAQFSTAPGLRYGTGFSDYAPEFGFLGEDGQRMSEGRVQNAGRADVLPTSGDGAGLPVLFAVLALAGASAGLVRTWVLRQALG